MRKLKVALLALALIGLTTSAARAVDQAWFTLVSGGTLVSEGPGQTLVIEKPQDGTTVLTIGYNFTSALDGAGGMGGWAIDLNGPGDITGGGMAWLGVGYTANSGAANFNGNLIDNFGQTAIPPTGNDGLVGTFTLTIEKQPGDPTKTRDIFGDFGVGAQSGQNGRWSGFVGANPFATQGSDFYGFNGYDTAYDAGGIYRVGKRASLPVITINNIPEPATIALLGLGVVALIRRRKA